MIDPMRMFLFIFMFLPCGPAESRGRAHAVKP
jgi:hypothetical protein